MSHSNVTHYKFRLTPSKSNNQGCFTELLDYLESNKYTYAYVREGGNSATELHYHFYFIIPLEISKLRYQLRKFLGTGGKKGNSVFSLAILELEEQSLYPIEYLAYLYKSKSPVFLSGSIPEEVLAAAQAYSSEFDSQRAKRVPRSLIKRLQETFEETFTFDSDLVRWLNKDREVVQSKDVLQLVVNYFQSEECLVRESSIICYTQTLMLRYDPIYGENLVSRLIQKI